MSDFGLTITGEMPNATATPFDLMAHEPGQGEIRAAAVRERTRESDATGPLPHGRGSDDRADSFSDIEEPFAVDYIHGQPLTRSELRIASREILIGTTEAMTNGSNEVARRAVYTVFGEPIYEDGVPVRYGYAGAWGYQEGQISGDPLQELGWLHVGARYYDPAAGRFMQRDPIGIRGGMNTYEYVMSRPTNAFDPTGLSTVDMTWDWYDFGDYVGAGATAGATTVGLGGANAIGVVKGVISGGTAGGVYYSTRYAYSCVCSTVQNMMEANAIERRNEEQRRAHPEIWPPRETPPPLGACFPYGTPVRTQNGLVSIDSLSVGDCILGYDVAGASQCDSMVLKTYKSSTSYFIDISIYHETIRCTPTHPFYVAGKGFIFASSITPGDYLLTSNGSYEIVLNVTSSITREPVCVYNIQVDSGNTYFVGTTGVLVHNKQP